MTLDPPPLEVLACPEDKGPLLYFADEQMKTADNYFRGFPALWNAVAFHLFVLKLPPWIAAAAVAGVTVSVPRVGERVDPSAPPAADSWWASLGA